jgi:hypothetical protein
MYEGTVFRPGDSSPEAFGTLVKRMVAEAATLRDLAKLIEWITEQAKMILAHDPPLAKGLRDDAQAAELDGPRLLSMVNSGHTRDAALQAFYLGQRAERMGLVLKYEPAVRHGKAANKGLFRGRKTKRKKKTPRDAEIRSAVQRKLDAGLSVNCAQHRVADERREANLPLKPFSFTQVWRITRDMKAKKKQQK